jgi:3-methyladenine DNA glycosylase/8-oxoguanine DNA glycosylase
MASVRSSQADHSVRVKAPPTSARMGTRAFDTDAAVAHLRTADRVLAKTIERVGEFRLALQRTPSTFGALAEAIVYQQLNPKAAATIFGRLCALFPDSSGFLEAEHIEGAQDAVLRSAGLSGSKLLSLRDLARRTVDGSVPTLRAAQRMDDETLLERLVQVRGIGTWTAQMFLIFRLGRPDILPLDDYGLRRGFAIVFKRPDLPDKNEIANRGTRWAPYRSVASWYLWRAADSGFGAGADS